MSVGAIRQPWPGIWPASPISRCATRIAAHGLKGFDVAKHRVDKNEPVYDPKGQPRADFFTENG